MKNVNPTTTSSWEILKGHYSNLSDFNLKESFKDNPARAEHFTIIHDDFYVDLSKNLLTTSTKDVLNQLARECELEDAITSYFSGEPINATEGREVLHTALRTPLEKADGKLKNYVKEALASKKKMFDYVDQVLDGTHTTFKGEKFDTVVNIGIGGSDLGPVMVYSALEAYHNNLNVHFVSNVDGDHIEETLKKLNPETTLFIIVSKSFGTQETLTNATTIRNWFSEKISQDAVSKHFIAVSSNIELAMKFGVDEKNIFPMFDWVGGRFSLWSTVGMSIALGIGNANFQELLNGAHEMDEHFKTEHLDKNIPVQLALLTI